MRNQAWSCVAALVLLAGSAFAGVTITPTTTLSALTSNNTSASSSFTALSDGDATPGNVSKASIHQVLYAGFNGKILAHYMPWWGNSGHINIGYSSHDATQAEREVEDMMSRGFDGVMVAESHSGSGDWDNVGTLTLFTAVQNHPGFLFAVSENKGGFNSTTDVTTQLVQHMAYDYQHYFTSPNYLTWNGRPVVFFFDGPANISGIDWASAKQQSQQYGNPIWVFRNSSGFGYTGSDGGFSWIGFPTSTDLYGLAYLDYFYKNAVTETTKMSVGSFWKGFNDTLASWGSNRITPQYCGTTWLKTLADAGNWYGTSSAQLAALQVATWNDYEEGTEIETGIDNCATMSASVSGGTLNFGPSFSSSSGSESTVDHYAVWVSTDGQNLMELAQLPAGSRTLNLSSYSFAAGTYYLYVQMVGKPSILNKMSGKVTYTVATTTTTTSTKPVVTVTSPTASSVNSPVYFAATATSSHPITGWVVYVDNNSAYQVNATSLSANVTLAAGTHSAYIRAWDSSGAYGTSSTFSITVPSTTTSTTSTAPTGKVSITSPSNGYAKAQHWIQVKANAVVSNGPVKSMEVWIDGVKAYSALNVSSISPWLYAAPGKWHTIQVLAYDASYNCFKSTTISIYVVS